MATDNLITVLFSAEEVQKLTAAIAEIENVLRGKTVNLTPDERRQYGSIAEQNKLFVNKSKELMDAHPQHVPAFLDKAEFDRDYAARRQIDDVYNRLQRITEQLGDTKVLLDHDNYTAALTYYRYVKFLARTNAPGSSSMEKELQQFFKRKKVVHTVETSPSEME